MENNNATNVIKGAAPTERKNKSKSRSKSKPKPPAKSKMKRPLQDLCNIKSHDTLDSRKNPSAQKNPSAPTGIVPSSKTSNDFLAKQVPSSKTSCDFLAEQMNLNHINFCVKP